MIRTHNHRICSENLVNQNARQMNLKSAFMAFIFRVSTDLEREPIVFKECAKYDRRNSRQT
jgi:hypothetical protein